MKPIRLLLLLVSALLLTSTASYAYVVAPQSAEAAAAYKDASSTGLSAKEMRKELRAKKRTERRAKFLAWIMKKAQDDQVVAILLALFVGGLGIHRVFLGSKPIIILWYLITFGGFFGIIPLIDLIRLILGQVDFYRNNDSLFRAFQSA